MKTTSLKNVITAFINGEEAQTANGSLKSKIVGDKTVLIGYRWAVYAENWQGQFYFHAGWYGYSVTTSKHYNKAHAMAGSEAGPQGICMQDGDKPQLQEYSETISY